jgi:hypothetical protein
MACPSSFHGFSLNRPRLLLRNLYPLGFPLSLTTIFRHYVLELIDVAVQVRFQIIYETNLSVCPPDEGRNKYTQEHRRTRGKNTTFIHLNSLSYDRSKASSKASSPRSAIQSFLLQMRVSSPFLKVIQ